MINESVKNGYSSVSPVRENVPAVLPVTGPTSLAASDTVAESAKAQTPAPTDMGKVREAVSKLNDHVQNLRRTLSFSIEESTGRTVIKVYDAETEELIRQIPPEETIRLAEVIEDQNASLFIEERA
jgi:flagellar protein FlaG